MLRKFNSPPTIHQNVKGMSLYMHEESEGVYAGMLGRSYTHTDFRIYSKATSFGHTTGLDGLLEIRFISSPPVKHKWYSAKGAVQVLIDLAKKLKLSAVFIEAQPKHLKFYESLGFRKTDPNEKGQYVEMMLEVK